MNGFHVGCGDDALHELVDRYLALLGPGAAAGPAGSPARVAACLAQLAAEIVAAAGSSPLVRSGWILVPAIVAGRPRIAAHRGYLDLDQVADDRAAAIARPQALRLAEAPLQFTLFEGPEDPPGREDFPA